MTCVLMFDLREAAKSEPNVNTAKHLRQVADDIDDALTTLNIYADSDSLEWVNGLWALGTRLLMIHKANLPEPPTGGAVPVPLEMAA